MYNTWNYKIEHRRRDGIHRRLISGVLGSYGFSGNFLRAFFFKLVIGGKRETDNVCLLNVCTQFTSMAKKKVPFMLQSHSLTLAISIYLLSNENMLTEYSTRTAGFTCERENRWCQSPYIFYWISVGRTKCTLIIYISEVWINGKSKCYSHIFNGKIVKSEIPTNRTQLAERDEDNLAGVRCCCRCFFFASSSTSSLLYFPQWDSLDGLCAMGACDSNGNNFNTMHTKKKNWKS